MTIFFSASKNGFLDSDIFGDLPSPEIPDAVFVSDEHYKALREDYLAGKEIVIDNHGEPTSIDKVIPLADLKKTKLLLIENEQNRLIESGFISSALGEDHTYSSDKDSQFNLVGSDVASEDTFYKCADSNGVSEFRFHTAAQIHQVLIDGKNVKLGIMQAAEVKRYQVSIANSISDLDAITVTT